MPLSKRIIPCLDVDRGRVLKGVQFKGLKDTGDPVTLACKYRDDYADELVFLDITASLEKRDNLRKLVSKVAANLDIPFTVGGGIWSLDDARLVLCSGADKVAVNTAVVKNPSLVYDLAKKFGSQCIVVSIDAKSNQEKPSGYEVYTYGARKPSGLDALEWAKKVEELGSGEILLTSIDRDGTEYGYDINITKLISKSVNIPVIASGGCGKPEHMLDAFTKAGADAALAASIFHYEEFKISYVKQFLKDKGVNIRL